MAQAAANRAQEAADRADSEVGRFLRAEAAERRAGS
jgi:hypothetical protein